MTDTQKSIVKALYLKGESVSSICKITNITYNKIDRFVKDEYLDKLKTAKDTTRQELLKDNFRILSNLNAEAQLNQWKVPAETLKIRAQMLAEITQLQATNTGALLEVMEQFINYISDAEVPMEEAQLLAKHVEAFVDIKVRDET